MKTLEEKVYKATEIFVEEILIPCFLEWRADEGNDWRNKHNLDVLKIQILNEFNPEYRQKAIKKIWDLLIEVEEK